MTCGAVVSLQPHDGVERHHLAGLRRARRAAAGRRAGAEPLIGLHVDAIGAVVEVEVVDVLRAEEHLQRVGHLAQRQRRGCARCRDRCRRRAADRWRGSCENAPATAPTLIALAPIELPTSTPARSLMSARRSGRAPRTGSRRTPTAPGSPAAGTARRSRPGSPNSGPRTRSSTALQRMLRALRARRSRFSRVKIRPLFGAAPLKLKPMTENAAGDVRLARSRIFSACFGDVGRVLERRAGRRLHDAT